MDSFPAIKSDIRPCEWCEGLDPPLALLQQKFYTNRIQDSYLEQTHNGHSFDWPKNNNSLSDISVITCLEVYCQGSKKQSIAQENWPECFLTLFMK